MTIAEWSPNDVLTSGTARIATTWSTTEIIQVDADGFWTVLDPETGIFGAGDAAEAAQVDFEQALRDHLAVLEGQDALSDGLAQQLAYLRRRLNP